MAGPGRAAADRIGAEPANCEAMAKATTKSSKRHMKGFAPTAKFVSADIRKAGEKRGFAETRVLTHWAEIVGDEVASISRPVDVRFSRGAFGATLRVLTTGANAPMLEMQKERLRERVNAVYGFNAISKVRITQTAPTGFSDGRVEFKYAPKVQAPLQPDPQDAAEASKAAEGVENEAQERAVKAMGCDEVQGFMYAKPMPEKELITYLQAKQ